MKETRMSPAYSANLVANSGNTIYWVSAIVAIIPLSKYMMDFIHSKDETNIVLGDCDNNDDFHW